MMPIAIIPRKPRRLQGEGGADMLVARRRDQSLKARSDDTTRARASEVIIDDLDLLPAPCARMLRERILPTLTLQMLVYLRDRRLPDIHIRGALEVLGRDLGGEQGAHGVGSSVDGAPAWLRSSSIQSVSTRSRTGRGKACHDTLP